MARPKAYSRTLRSRVGGKLLKLFDSKCAEQELNESEAIREAIRVYVNYATYSRIGATDRTSQNKWQ